MEPVLLNNRYRLLELIGSGGMAVVYQGVDTLLQRRVAVKVLREGFAGDPAFLARFQREARAAANLEHPAIVTVYDVGQDGDRHYIVMEYVDGQDLKALIRQKGRLGVDETLDIVIQICAGVGHAHQAGVIHCDIKPQNVLVTQDGRAKVTDFGIARALSEAGLTESETVWGSPLYFSPEQAAGEPPSPASDVYSIGVVMYEMLAGSPPFQAENPTALALMHMREDPPPLAVRNPRVPPQLEWIVRKVLAKEPSARYRTAGQLAHVIEEYRERGEQRTGWQPIARNGGGTPPLPSPGYTVEAEPHAVSQTALDRLAWVLGIIAFVAVGGLIPLWWGAYQLLFAPSPPPPPATSQPVVTLTPAVQLILVPPLVEMAVDDAQRAVEQAGLRFVLLEERYEPGVEKGIVLAQRPASSELVPPDSEVAVVVSGPGRELAMPPVVGYSVEVVRAGLESDGLRVISSTVWSTQPEGMVITQEPGPGTTIHAGDTVTLTVSAGVDAPIPLQVGLADQIILESAELQHMAFQPGEVIAVTLHWRALHSISTPYVVFVHLIGPDGGLVAQQDVEPVIPTTTWAPGVEVVDPHLVTIPAGQMAGGYQLRTGMYPQGQPSSRLTVVDAGLTTADAGSILITEVQIQP